MQLQKKTETPAKEELEALKAKFEAAKSKVIPATEIKPKIVNLRLISRCGCGGSDSIDIHLRVPDNYNEFGEMEIVDRDDLYKIKDAGYDVYESHFYGDPSDDTHKTVW